MGTQNVIIYNHGKNELSIKNTPGYIQYADAQKKVLCTFVFDLNSFQDFFLQDFTSFDLISLDFIGNPQSQIILGKKSQESKTQDFIFGDILSQKFRKLQLYYQSFYFQVFSFYFLHRFIKGTIYLRNWINTA